MRTWNSDIWNRRSKFIEWSILAEQSVPLLLINYSSFSDFHDLALHDSQDWIFYLTSKNEKKFEPKNY